MTTYSEVPYLSKNKSNLYRRGEFKMHGKYKPIKYNKSDIIHVIVAIPIVLIVAFIILSRIP